MGKKMTDEEQQQIRQMVQVVGLAFLDITERLAKLEKIILWSNLASPELHEVALKMSKLETAQVRKQLESLGEPQKTFEDILKNFEGPPQ
jgi:hypothetical protein